MLFWQSKTGVQDRHLSGVKSFSCLFVHIFRAISIFLVRFSALTIYGLSELVCIMPTLLAFSRLINKLIEGENMRVQ